MNLANAILAENSELPPIAALGYEYVVAGNGLFVRAEDSRMEALIPIAWARLHGLATPRPYARLKVPRLPEKYLHAVMQSAQRRLPNECMYQFFHQPASGWRCAMPEQKVSHTAVTFSDSGEAIVDLHSHNTMAAFFSSTDNQDETGLRFYAVVGCVGTSEPVIALRVGVYGHHWPVPVTTIFESTGPFKDVGPDELADPVALMRFRAADAGYRAVMEFGEVFKKEQSELADQVHDAIMALDVRTCRFCGCTDENPCLEGCSWVESDLCSQCAKAREWRTE